MNIALWIVQVLLAALFGFAGFLHGYQIEKAKAQLAWAKDTSRLSPCCDLSAHQKSWGPRHDLADGDKHFALADAVGRN